MNTPDSSSAAPALAALTTSACSLSFPWRAVTTAFATLALAASALAWDVVATGLNNPRGLDFAPNGALYVAEAGLGGPGPTYVGPDGGLMYFGLSGSITRVRRAQQQRIVTGLPSAAAIDGTGAIGPSDLSFGHRGVAFLTIGLGRPPAVRDAILGDPAQRMGSLLRLSQEGDVNPVADLAVYEQTHDPDHNGPDTNPNGVLNLRGGDAYVADAGANDLLHVSASGKISTVAVFPNRGAMQPVPTNVAVGPDGALYVCELTGGPFPVGGAQIYRVVPGAPPTVYAVGFTNIIDLKFDDHGNLYVLEIATHSLISGDPTGRLARINATTHAVETIASAGLVMPGGLAIGPDGALYVSNFSVMPAIGQVVRIVP